ncbi:CHRD domain-containing protein [Sporobolomyces salmoneus]|uniref:CHRD domain-containing protein n=1 Tax=Sporobolomyces salmoneus TaxID=183962 RepID=UPI00317A9AF5
MRFSTALLVAALPALAAAAPLNDGKKWDYKESHHKDAMDLNSKVFDFSSTYVAYASPDQIINNNQTAVPGEEGASGVFKFGIVASEEVICYSIAVEISGDYQSPANTATHIHEAPFGRAGPPRIAFPNPTGDSPIDEFGRRTSYGCLKGPFTTGVIANGADTAEGFSLSQIEANPPAFFADTHTSKFVAGAVRGQLELTGSIY